jgi:hypothetical protein
MTYSTDNESFILEVQNIPSASATIPLAKTMLDATRRIESALVQKLNCMYFVSRSISLPSVENLLKKERSVECSKEMYLDFSHELNRLINTYFCIENEEDMEVKIAGSEENRNDLMPILYVSSHREKAELESEIRRVLKEFHHGQGPNQILDPSNRMKPLDCAKVLMGIHSSRECVKRFQSDGSVWARRQDYDYNDVLKMCEAVVQAYYEDVLPSAANAVQASKRIRE